MNRTKIGVTDIALEMFAEADDDGSGELSVIEIFCFLPELDKRIRSGCRILAPGEVEPESGKLRIRITTGEVTSKVAVVVSISRQCWLFYVGAPTIYGT